MISTRRKYFNSPYSLCYICENSKVPKQRMNISDFGKRADLAYFQVRSMPYSQNLT